MILQRNWGRTNASGTQGDASGDGVVGYNDMVMWRNFYGTTAGSFAAFAASDDEAPAAAAVADEPLEEQVAVMLDGVTAGPAEAPLVEAILIVDTDTSADSIEVSAQASTSAVPMQFDAASVAMAIELLKGSGEEGLEDVVALEFDDLDAAFDSSSNLTDLGLVLRKEESAAYRYDDESLASEGEDENVFELAFAEEADWRQF
jgi:hypothetical protein